MKKKSILILGGNRFFGLRLAKQLTSNGHKVTVLNRGSNMSALPESVEHIECDKGHRSLLEEKTANRHWDCIVDQICYDFDEAKAACEVFKGKTDHYLFTSSQSVYPLGDNLTEDMFAPSRYVYESKVSSKEDYAEAKRQAEHAFSLYAPFPVTMMRLPIVFGEDDYTERFQFHTKKLETCSPLAIKNPEAKLSLLSAKSAAESIVQLIQSEHNGVGPLNICHKDPITVPSLLSMIANKKGFPQAKVQSSKGSDAELSPYALTDHWVMNTKKLDRLGLSPAKLETEILNSIY